VLPIVAAVLLALAAGVGVSIAASSGGDDVDASATSASASPPSTGPTATVDEATTTSARPSTTTPPVTTSPTRPGEVFSGDTRLRDAPSLAANPIRHIQGRNGSGLEVLEEASATQPWYRVRIDGAEGYIFAAFVLPPAPGLCVAVTSGSPPDVYDANGALVQAEKSGEKVLISGPEDGAGYPVVLPGGQRGYVHPSSVGTPICG